MRACAERQWGTATLSGRRIGIAGVGKVGRHLVDHLVDDGAEVVVTDVSAAAVAAVTAKHPQVRTVADADSLVRAPLDVYAPCALGGGAVRRGRRRAHRAGRLRRREQPAGPPGVEKLLADRGVLYAPDYVVNSGGVIQVAGRVPGIRAGAGPDQGDGDLRHHPAALRRGRPRRASHLRSRPIGWPSGGWPRSAGCAGILVPGQHR